MYIPIFYLLRLLVLLEAGERAFENTFSIGASKVSLAMHKSVKHQNDGFMCGDQVWVLDYILVGVEARLIVFRSLV